jgi:hypothetical protein
VARAQQRLYHLGPVLIGSSSKPGYAGWPVEPVRPLGAAPIAPRHHALRPLGVSADATRAIEGRSAGSRTTPTPERSAWPAEDLDAKIAVVRELAAEYDAIRIPLNELLTARAAKEGAPKFIDDGVHPSADGYELIAQLGGDGWRRPSSSANLPRSRAESDESSAPDPGRPRRLRSAQVDGLVSDSAPAHRWRRRSCPTDSPRSRRDRPSSR